MFQTEFFNIFALFHVLRAGTLLPHNKKDGCTMTNRTTARLRPLLALCWLVAGCSTQPKPAGQWAAPGTPLSLNDMPAIKSPVLLDGELAEWTGIPCIALRSPGCIAARNPAHEWKGPADAGAQIHCAWTPNALYLAFDVSDDDLRNDREDAKSAAQDCVEILVDVGDGDLWKLFLRPPVDAVPARIIGIDPQKASFSGLQVAAKKTAAGYSAELRIPWSTWPAFAPRHGAKLALFFRLDEYDSRDGQMNQPLRMTWRGIGDLGGDRKQKMIQWILADHVKDADEQAYRLLSSAKTPWVVLDPKSVPVILELDKALKPPSSLRLTVDDHAGNRVLDTVSKPLPNTAEWGSTLTITCDWPAALMDGYHVATLIAEDASGRALLNIRQPVLVTAGTYSTVLNKLHKADLPRLSQEDPFRANAWLGLGANVEKLKRMAETHNLPGAISMVGEMQARLRTLEGRAQPSDEIGLLNLLDMAADPQSQVVVEYGRPDAASVTFYCGAIPLAQAWINRFPSKEKALGSIAGRKGVLRQLDERGEMAGYPSRFQTQMYKLGSTMLTNFVPDRQVLAIDPGFTTAYAIESTDMNMLAAKQVVILPDCPDKTRAVVAEWAAKKKTSLVSLSDISTNIATVIAGNVAAHLPSNTVQSIKVSNVSISKRITRLAVAADRLGVTVECPSRPVAEKVAEWVIAGRRISPDDADTLRQMMVRSVGPGNLPAGKFPVLPAGMQLFAGDMHMHTFYSDGSPSPIGLALEAMYCNLDFAVMAEHNTLAGAQVAQRLLARHGFAFPFSVGEEITTDWSHFNAYPLTNVIPWKTNLETIVKAAHDQNAVIQWNHPGFPYSIWTVNQMPKILEGTGIDAWEHYPEEFEEWKKAGKVPVLTGTTDTHDGTFDSPERTIMLAPAATGADVAAAVRSGNVVALSPDGGRLLYGPDQLTAIVWQAIAEGKTLKAIKADRIKTVLRNADIVGLLKSSPPHRIDPQSL